MTSHCIYNLYCLATLISNYEYYLHIYIMNIVAYHVKISEASSIKEYIRYVIADAMEEVKTRLHNEAQMVYKMQDVVDSSPFRYVSAFMGAKPYVKYISLSGMSMLQALKMIKHKYDIEGPELFEMIRRMSQRPALRPMPGVYHPDEDMPIPSTMDTCPYPSRFDCQPLYPYRSQDGTCNNLNVPIWGRSLVPFKRLLPAVYGDGIESARLSVLGEVPLPSARVISLHLFPDFNRPEQQNTMMMMSFGQFIDHDLTRTAITKMSKDETFFDTSNMDEVKCGFDGCETGQPGLEACWPIPIPDEDPDFPYNRCLKFVRSQEVPPLSCTYGPREQLNQLTSWLDASQIYGSSVEETISLRDFSNKRRGRLLSTSHPHGPFYKPLLPQDNVELCRDVNETVKCFKAGDERVNENAPLSVIHTVWMREHNRIEEQLHVINPHWDGEKLFQETRKLMGAMMQHVVYNEYLPTVVGPEIMKQYGLELVKHGFYRGYDQKISPQAPTAFATAAFRFGHTLIDEKIRRADYHYNFDDSLKLSEVFRRPAPLYDTKKGGVDSLLRGMVEQPCQSYDQFFTKQVTKSLFTDRPPFGVGMDLISLNIQRSRDHGLPGYNAYREFCGLRRASNFEDLAHEVKDARARRMLQKMYRHPDDIDLFAGGVSETPMANAVVGPTFACIIAETFRDLRRADRFWYENDNGVGFTSDQIQEIKNTRLAKLLCYNSDYVEKIQPNVFFHSANDYVPALNQFEDLENHEAWFDSSAYINNYVRNPHVTTFQDMPNEFRRLTDKFPKLSNLPPMVAYNVRVPCRSFPSVDLRKWRQAPYSTRQGYK